MQISSNFLPAASRYAVELSSRRAFQPYLRVLVASLLLLQRRIHAVNSHLHLLYWSDLLPEPFLEDPPIYLTIQDSSCRAMWRQLWRQIKRGVFLQI